MATGKDPDPDAPRSDDHTPAVPGTKDTPAVRDEICGRMAEGESLHQILKDPDKPAHLPTYRNVMKWLHDPRDRHREFREQFFRAQRAFTFYYLDHGESEAMSKEDGWMWSAKKQCYVPDNYAIQHMRVILEHARWRAKVVLPDLFGDKMRLDVTERDDEPGPRIDWTKLSDSALREVRNAMYYPDEQDGAKPDERVVGEQ